MVDIGKNRGKYGHVVYVHVSTRHLYVLTKQEFEIHTNPCTLKSSSLYTE